MNMELRFNETEIRVNPDGSMTVSGYVNKTMQPSQVLGSTKKFIEKIARGCFQKAINSSTRDIDFLTEHDDDKILASTRNGSLSLKEDDTGLYMEANITPTSYGKDTYELIKSGILRNMSFGFRVLKDTWKMIGANLFERTVEEMELYEVSVVRDPAYTQSTIAARGINIIEEAKIPSEILEEADQMEELRKILEGLQETVSNLETEIKELRTAKGEEVAKSEEETEVNDDSKNAEEKRDITSVTSPSDIESIWTAIKELQQDVLEIKKDMLEDDIEELQEDQDKLQEKIEDVQELQQDIVEDAQEIQQKQDELQTEQDEVDQGRSQKLDSEYSELRQKLDALRK